MTSPNTFAALSEPDDDNSALNDLLAEYKQAILCKAHTADTLLLNNLTIDDLWKINTSLQADLLQTVQQISEEKTPTKSRIVLAKNLAQATNTTCTAIQKLSLRIEDVCNFVISLLVPAEECGAYKHRDSEELSSEKLFPDYSRLYHAESHFSLSSFIHSSPFQ